MNFIGLTQKVCEHCAASRPEGLNWMHGPLALTAAFTGRLGVRPVGAVKEASSSSFPTGHITARPFLPPSNDAEADGASWSEVARTVLHIGDRRTTRARHAWKSYLARAKWMTEHGYKHLLRAAATH
jgi:hypothetical protein